MDRRRYQSLSTNSFRSSPEAEMFHQMLRHRLDAADYAPFMVRLTKGGFHRAESRARTISR